jgi:hypothetical protein
MNPRGIRSRTLTGYCRCIPLRDENGREIGSARCCFPSPPWWGVTSKERGSAVTLLKASGLSDVFAREIVGHESAAVSRQYTHLSTDDLRKAMKRLPDVTG